MAISPELTAKSLIEIERELIRLFSPGGFISGGTHTEDEFLLRSRGTMGSGSIHPGRVASTKEIHQAFDDAAGEEERRANAIMEYRQMYPGNAFLTKSQVRDLCLRYNLVMAPDFIFAGEIPERNRAERAAFRLHEKHDVMRTEEYHDLASRLYARSVAQSTRGETTFDTEVVMPNNLHDPYAMVVSGDFALYCPDGFMSLRRLTEGVLGRSIFDPDIFDKIVPVVRTRKGFVRLHGNMVCPISMDIERYHSPMWERDDFSFARETTVRFRFYIQDLTCLRDFSYNNDVCQMVVCHSEMLHQNIPFQLKEGWECVFSQNKVAPRSRGRDPLILQPVEHGYLVVTKWDAEARLPEVAGQTN